MYGSVACVQSCGFVGSVVPQSEGYGAAFCACGDCACWWCIPDCGCAGVADAFLGCGDVHGPGHHSKHQRSSRSKLRIQRRQQQKRALLSSARTNVRRKPTSHQYVELYLNQRPQQHAVDLAEVNALTQTLLELAEETEIKINTLQEFAHCVLVSGTRESVR